MLVKWRGAVVALAVTIAALVAPGAALAAPANDAFADRQDLTAWSLPIELTGSNVGATKEAGEFLAAFSSGHSVWFEWTAAASGWVTVSGCSPDFTAVLGVYQGTAVDSLTAVTSGNGSEGPYFCDYATGGVQTFWAESGETYVIAEDSSGFYLPDGPPPIKEGNFTLRIEATPVPPNDAFAAAIGLTGEIGEEPNGNRPYFARANGHNWGATKEAGEPAHGGDQGGASVWYSWVAPASGSATISACCFGPKLVAVYRGASLGEIEPVAPAGPPLHAYPVLAGETYRIAVDGPYDDAAAAAAMGSFNLFIAMQLPPLPREERPGEPPLATTPAADATPPRTSLGKRTISQAQPKATFRFSSNEAGSRFRCRIDKQKWRACRSPKSYSNLAPGRHVFKVIAVDAAGNADKTPAVARFKISA